MQSTKRRDDELQGSVDHGRIPEDDQGRPSDDEIARRAYERYEARGREDGHALDDWLDAERDLNGAPPHQ
jgi:Protein of unknown function (DUF2934)